MEIQYKIFGTTWQCWVGGVNNDRIPHRSRNRGAIPGKKNIVFCLYLEVLFLTPQPMGAPYAPTPP